MPANLQMGAKRNNATGLRCHDHTIGSDGMTNVERMTARTIRRVRNHVMRKPINKLTTSRCSYAQKSDGSPTKTLQREERGQRPDNRERR